MLTRGRSPLKLRRGHVKSLVFVLIMLVSFGAWATEPVPGQEYTGPQKFELAQLGLSFDLPKGWTGGIPPGQEIFVMAAPEVEGFIFLSVNQSSQAEITQTMAGQIPLDEGMVLIPSATPKTKKNKVTNTYTVTGTEYSGEGTAIIGPSGVSLLVLALAAPAGMDSTKKAANAVIASAKLTKPKAAKSNVGKAGSGPWDARIRGKRLIRFYSGNDYSERETYDLCADGTYIRKISMGGTSILGTGNVRDDDRGLWTIKGNVFTAQTQSGDTWSVELNQVGNELRINGVKWFIDGPAACN